MYLWDHSLKLDFMQVQPMTFLWKRLYFNKKIATFFARFSNYEKKLCKKTNAILRSSGKG